MGGRMLHNGKKSQVVWSSRAASISADATHKTKLYQNATELVGDTPMVSAVYVVAGVCGRLEIIGPIGVWHMCRCS